MAATQPLFNPRYVGIIKTVKTSPPSVIIIPQLGGPLVTATDFTPAQLSTMLMCLSVDMRQVTYTMKLHPTGWQAQEVLCVGEVSSVLKEEPDDIWLRSARVDGKKSKGGRRKGNVNANNSKLVAPPAPNVEEEWTKNGDSHEVLQSKSDPIMGHSLRQAVYAREERLAKVSLITLAEKSPLWIQRPAHLMDKIPRTRTYQASRWLDENGSFRVFGS